MWPFKKADAFEVALKTHIDGDFSVFAAGKDAPMQSDIAAFERTFTCKLPDDFREYSCSKLGGIYVQAKESVWPPAQKFEVAPFWSFLNGLHVYAFSAASPEWMNIQSETEKFRRETNTLLIPCLKILMDADVYCFDTEGELRRWNHETNEAPLQNKTFTEIFVMELAELRKRKDRKKAEAKAI